nr:AAA family ATPase [Actinomycetota bacterium]
VFTDLVASTELASGLGPVAAEEVRSTHFGLLRDAVGATGGSVVKNLGDGLMVVFPSLGAALDGAVAMQQNIELHNRKAAVLLGVRIGVSSGDASEEDGDYFGEPIVEAARLCAIANGGQIVTTEMVRLLARRSGHDFGPLGQVELKGMPEPVEAFELRWVPAKAPASAPMPGRLTNAPATGLVGRAAESEQLLTALKASFTGDGHRVVLLSGDAGIGKTTLAGDVAQRAYDDGATVLYGRCDEDVGVPYQPFVQAVGDFLRDAFDGALATVDERHLSELSRLLPQVGERVAGLAEPATTDADAERYLLFGAVTSFLSGLAQAAPVVLVLDDLHWADKSTVVLLRHLVTTLGDAEVLIVGTYRDSDVTATHPLTDGLAALRREAHVERVAVGGLDDNAVVALLEALAGHELDRAGIALAHAVRRETDGNPFFTAEVLRHLAETAAIRQEDGRWVATVELASIGLPESVREVVGQRVRRLGPDTHQLLTLASVIGRDFDLTLLARVADQTEDSVLAALEEAADAAVVSEVDGLPERFTFTHGLIQFTLYDELSSGRRARVHRKIGELLEAECGNDPGDRIGELAHHWMAATRPADAGKAAAYARMAGDRALSTLAPHEAIRWFGNAVELLNADPKCEPRDRLDSLIGLGDAQRQAGDAGYRDTLLAAAAEAARLDDTKRLVRAVLANQRGTVSSIGTIDSERVAMLERALVAVGDEDSRDRASLLASLVAELSFAGDIDRLRALAAEAEAMARRLVDEVCLLNVLNLTFLSLWVPDGLARTVEVAREVVTIAERIGDPVARFWAAMNSLYAMASKTDRAGSHAALDQAEALATAIGQPYLSWQVLYMRCMLVLLSGDADQAEELATEALQISSDSGQPDAIVVFGAGLAGIRLHQGRLDEILPLIEQVAADNPGLPGFQAAYAMMLCECGRGDEARPVLQAALAADFNRDAYDYVWLTTTTLWADAAASVKDAAAAAVLFDRLAPFEAQGVVSGATFSGTVGMYLARLAVVLGRDREAAELFERADVQLRALEAPYLRARNQLEWARLLSTKGDEQRRQARYLSTEALNAAVRCGCSAVERGATELGRTLA